MVRQKQSSSRFSMMPKQGRHPSFLLTKSMLSAPLLVLMNRVARCFFVVFFLCLSLCLSISLSLAVSLFFCLSISLSLSHCFSVFLYIFISLPNFHLSEFRFYHSVLLSQSGRYFIIISIIIIIIISIIIMHI